MASIKSATSPLFVERIEGALGAVRVTHADCGAPVLLRRGGVDARSPVGCARHDGVCLACYTGGDGPATLDDNVGRAAATGFKVALRAYGDRAQRRTDATIQPRWPEAVARPESARAPLALSEGPVYLAELFEARVTPAHAILSEFEGEVVLGRANRTTQPVTVRAASHEKHYGIPLKRALRVGAGDAVRAGEALTDGGPQPHDVLRILGEHALVCWMIGEAQAIFRAVDVTLPERHVSLLLRRMLARVTVTEPNDAGFTAGQRVARAEFARENDQLVAQGKLPAYAAPLLEGLSELA
jgi:hypothetical protein